MVRPDQALLDRSFKQSTKVFPFYCVRFAISGAQMGCFVLFGKFKMSFGFVDSVARAVTNGYGTVADRFWPFSSLVCLHVVGPFENKQTWQSLFLAANSSRYLWIYLGGQKEIDRNLHKSQLEASFWNILNSRYIRTTSSIFLKSTKSATFFWFSQESFGMGKTHMFLIYKFAHATLLSLSIIELWNISLRFWLFYC